MGEITKSDIVDCLRNPSYEAYKGLKDRGLTVEQVNEFFDGRVYIEINTGTMARNFQQDFVDDDLRWLGTLTLDGMVGYVTNTQQMSAIVSDFLAKQNYSYDMTNDLLSVKDSLLAISNYPDNKEEDFNRGSFTYGSLDFFIYMFMVPKVKLNVKIATFTGNKGIIDCMDGWLSPSLADNYIAQMFARYMLIEYKESIRYHEKEEIINAFTKVYKRLGGHIEFIEELNNTQQHYLPLFKKACEDGSIKVSKKTSFSLNLKE